jgi:hypothetical protein
MAQSITTAPRVPATVIGEPTLFSHERVATTHDLGHGKMSSVVQRATNTPPSADVVLH